MYRFNNIDQKVKLMGVWLGVDWYTWLGVYDLTGSFDWELIVRGEGSERQTQACSSSYQSIHALHLVEPSSSDAVTPTELGVRG